ncbi:MAG: V-type ATPase 116kDa subunit family protein [Desulfobacterales bacterium]|nr:V-type ATPase 116kDa subunit family protein [Desulfobacterales bacterium]
MSKVEIVGPRQLLGETLSLVRKEGDLHIEPSAVGFIDDIHKKDIHSLLPDEKALFEKIFLEELEGKLKALFSCLSVDGMRESFLTPRPIIDTVSRTLDKHLEMCQLLCKKREEIRHDLFELSGYRNFLATVSTLLDKIQLTPDLDYIGITLKDEKSVAALKDNLNCLADTSCEIFTVPSEDGSLVGLIAATKDISIDIRSMLSEKRMPEFTFPESIKSMTFVHKVEYLQDEIKNNEAALAAVDAKLTEFTHRWGPMYKAALDWVHEQLSIIQASAFSFETTMCFFIYGWMPSGKVTGLSASLQQQFAGSVLLEEIDIRREDLERVPVVLKNPQYFKPFENFTRLLPLPSYTSFDPTPFIGLFFPLFFGLILGDGGYGLMLLIISLLLTRVSRKNQLFQDALRVLRVCSLYAIIFGFLYGEIFGDLGHKVLGLKPLFMDRQENILPMLYFAFAIGLAHITLGLALGFVSALRKNTKKKALVKFLNIVLILAIVTLIITFFGVFPELLARPLVITILILTPLLLFSGGLLAPLELIKNIGNIISYARIMAIGLTSVLLANVANQLAGLTGDIVLGFVVGGIIHLLGIIIGVFSSSIHSLRLHYVEFFDKFIELGGRKYRPFSRNQTEDGTHDISGINEDRNNKNA